MADEQGDEIVVEEQKRGIGCFGLILRAVAAVVAVLFIVLGLAVLVAVNADLIGFSAQTYQDAFADTVIYDRLVEVVTARIMAGEDNSPAVRNMTQDEITSVVREAFTESWFGHEAARLIRDTLTYLGSDELRPEAALSMVEVKERLHRPETGNLVVEIIKAWPPCSQAQLNAAASADGGIDPALLPGCSPPASTMSAIAGRIRSLTARQADYLPDEFKLAADEAAVTRLNDLRNQIRFGRLAARFSPIVLALLLLLIGALAIRSFRDFGAWWGIPLLALGVLGTMLGAGMWMFGAQIAGLVVAAIPQIPPAEAPLPIAAGSYILEKLAVWIGTEGAVVALLTAALMIVGMIVARVIKWLGGTPAATPAEDEGEAAVREES